MKLSELQKVARILSAKFLKTSDQQQEDRLREWTAANESRGRLCERLQDPQHVRQGVAEYLGYDAGRDWPAVEARIRGRRRASRLRYTGCAAAVLVAVGAVLAIYRQHDTARELQAVQTILPGSPKARLVLPDGTTIDLNTPAGRDSTIYYDQAGFIVGDGTQASYPAADGGIEIQQHTIVIPRGGEFRLTLPDGSHVWLNAETQLSFPTRFTGGGRHVKLTGEAYFEVAHDASAPFTVETDGMHIQVLGTSFNVFAYHGQGQHATLVEGSVAVTGGSQRLTIRPGEQAYITAAGLEKTTVNVTDFVAWKERRLSYKNMPLAEVFRSLKRWYDVEAVFACPEAEQCLFTANLSKDETLDKVLEVITYVTGIECHVDGRRVVIGSTR